MLEQKATVLVEWGEKLPLDPATPRVEIRLEILAPDQRKFTLESVAGSTPRDPRFVLFWIRSEHR